MHDDDPRFSNVPHVTELHPMVYGALAGCVLWTVAGFWLLFSKESETMFQIAVVSFFAAAFVVTPFLMWRIAKAGKPAVRCLPFAEWRHARFETAAGTVPALEAAALVLLAPLACAIGLTVVSALRLFALDG